MKKSTQTKLIVENKRSHGIEVTVLDNGLVDTKFVIPVIDVRDGDEARAKVNAMVKAQNRSKFMNRSYSAGGNSYQVSQKP